MTATHTLVDSPVGPLTLTARDGVLSGVYFPGHWYPPAREMLGARADAGFDEAQRQLAEYFAGERRSFDLEPSAAGDPFQRRVWG